VRFEKKVVFSISDEELRKRLCPNCPYYKKLEEIKRILEFPVKRIKKEALTKTEKEMLRLVKRIKNINWVTVLVRMGKDPQKASKGEKASIQKKLRDLWKKGYLEKVRSYRTKVNGKRVMITDYRLT